MKHGAPFLHGSFTWRGYNPETLCCFWCCSLFVQFVQVGCRRAERRSVRDVRRRQDRRAAGGLRAGGRARRGRSTVDGASAKGTGASSCTRASRRLPTVSRSRSFRRAVSGCRGVRAPQSDRRRARGRSGVEVSGSAEPLLGAARSREAGAGDVSRRSAATASASSARTISSSTPTRGTR